MIATEQAFDPLPTMLEVAARRAESFQLTPPAPMPDWRERIRIETLLAARCVICRELARRGVPS